MDFNKYFSKNYKNNQSRLLLTIGIPGSGKSYGLKTASDQGWQIISSDQMRKERLIELKNQSQFIKGKDGKLELANENNANHLFSYELREWVNSKILFEAEQIFKSGKNLVLDVTNVTLQRVVYMNMGRKYGYSVEGFVFEPHSDLKVHLQNVEKRVREGGVDLIGSSQVDSSLARLKIIQSVWENYQCFCGDIKVSAEFTRFDENLSSDFDWKILKSASGTFLSFVDNIVSAKDRDYIRNLRSLDVFNDLHKFEVIPF